MEERITYIRKLSEKDLCNYLMLEDLHILHEIKMYLDDIYYNTGIDTGIDDYRYDMIKEYIETRDTNYTNPIGSKIRTGDNEVELPFWLGSMNKIKSEDRESLLKWVSKNPAEEYIVENKLDGISCLLRFFRGNISLYTRGDGKVGSDISYFAKYFKNIPHNLTDNIFVRGELIMNKHVFKEKYSKDFANPRNMVAGRIGSKTVRSGLNDIEFIAYEIVGDSIIPKAEDQLNVLSELGFKVVTHTLTDAVTPESLLEILLYNIQESPFEIDGLIVQPNVPYKRNTSGNPSYAFAFKARLDSNLINVTVEQVEWNVSKWGVIKPRIRITPVSLGGVTIKYTTGFNAKYINDNNIGPGSVLKLTRSGDVIPFIIEIVTQTQAQFPEASYKWNSTGVDIYTEENENIMCIKLISSFFSSLKIKYVSEATVSKMYEHGFNNILKIVSATKRDFEKIEGFGSRLAERTYDNIHAGLQNIPLHVLLGASGVFGMGMGTRKVELLINRFPDILTEYKNIPADELFKIINSIEGFSHKTTTKIVENLPWAEKFVNNLAPYIALKIQKRVSNDMENMKIVFSGFRDKDLEDEIKKRGGKVTTSVSKNTSMLVVADKSVSSSKIDKANELNIPIYNLDEFVDEFGF
jgi:NAD-dependent DNA ligase